jgi:hypothetical protein
MKLRIAFSLLALVAMRASAQEFDKVLLPIAPQRVEGAFGSVWITDLVISNLSTTPVRVSRTPVCAPICVPPPLPAKATVLVPDLVPASNVIGQFALVEKGRLHDVAMTLRSRDTSRQAETWGTSIPVVTAEDTFSRTFGLVDVPMEPQFRSTLRIYDINAATPPRVRVRIYEVSPSVSASSDPLIAEFEPAFSLPVPSQLEGFPASAEIPLWLDQELVKHNRVRVEIEPLDGAQDYWAFVSVTHNTTQHVTLITPQP